MLEIIISKFNLKAFNCMNFIYIFITYIREIAYVHAYIYRAGNR